MIQMQSHKVGFPTDLKDKDGRTLLVGDKLFGSDGHNYHIDKYGRLCDVVDKPTDIPASDLLFVCHGDLTKSGKPRKKSAATEDMEDFPGLPVDDIVPMDEVRVPLDEREDKPRKPRKAPASKAASQGRKATAKKSDQLTEETVLDWLKEHDYKGTLTRTVTVTKEYTI